ncbi:hypothetical protein [Calothrix rhizosoleniae]|nr:hypothetical protein [Calothrix rhizosoleniae]
MTAIGEYISSVNHIFQYLDSGYQSFRLDKLTIVKVYLLGTIPASQLPEV